MTRSFSKDVPISDASYSFHHLGMIYFSPLSTAAFHPSLGLEVFLTNRFGISVEMAKPFFWLKETRFPIDFAFNVPVSVVRFDTTQIMIIPYLSYVRNQYSLNEIEKFRFLERFLAETGDRGPSYEDVFGGALELSVRDQIDKNYPFFVTWGLGPSLRWGRNRQTGTITGPFFFPSVRIQVGIAL